MPVQACVETNPAVQEVSNLLARRFNAIEPKVHGELQAAYRKHAKMRHAALMAAIKDPANTGWIGGSRGDQWNCWH